MAQAVKIREKKYLTPNVLQLILDKPDGLTFIPGQAADISINKPEWKEEIRTFTFVSFPEDDYVEFNIKTYPDHQGVTNQLRALKEGDELIIADVYGDIKYKGEGLFIAGGAGITPFKAILKDLERQGKLGGNKLLFANNTKADIIWKEGFEKMLGAQFINVLSKEDLPGYEYGFITADMIKKYADANTKYYYLCGPPPMMDAVEKAFVDLGIDEEHIVKEGF